MWEFSDIGELMKEEKEKATLEDYKDKIEEEMGFYLKQNKGLCCNCSKKTKGFSEVIYSYFCEDCLKMCFEELEGRTI